MNIGQLTQVGDLRLKSRDSETVNKSIDFTPIVPKICKQISQELDWDTNED